MANQERPGRPGLPSPTNATCGSDSTPIHDLLQEHGPVGSERTTSAAGKQPPDTQGYPVEPAPASQANTLVGLEWAD